MFNICLLYVFSDHVLSITPKTQEQVDVVKNISTRYQVDMMVFYLYLFFSVQINT